MKKIFEGVFQEGKKIYTINAVPGTKVYGEPLLDSGGKEYREWIPTHSKLAAAIINKMREFPIKEGSRILYLGASTGTTVSHLSDIVGKSGIIYAVEFSERSFREFLRVCTKRRNIVPILADARKTSEYYWIEEVDFIYCDIAQPDQTEIALKNSKEFLAPKGYLLLSIKSQSIDVTKNPQHVYKAEMEKIKSVGMEVIQKIDLEPYEDKHALITARSEH